jgi:hypothetical protein
MINPGEIEYLDGQTRHQSMQKWGQTIVCSAGALVKAAGQKFGDHGRKAGSRYLVSMKVSRSFTSNLI